MKTYQWISMLIVLGMVLASCASPTPERIVETVIVEKQGETVVQTVEVPKTVIETVEVEKTVIQTVEVKKEIVEPKCDFAPPTEPVEITYIGWPGLMTDAYASFLQKCASVKNIDTNVRIMDNASAQEQMLLAFSSGSPSPYAIVHQANSSIQRNAWKDWLTPLTDLVEKYREKYNLDDIAPVHWEAATFDGKILGIPMAANSIIIMYRSDLFEKHNLKVPTTYDEIITACTALKEEPGINVPFGLDLSAGWAWAIGFFEALHSMGGDFFVEGENTPAFNSPQGVAALTKMKEVIDACMGPEGLAMGYQDLALGLQNGSVGFIHIRASSGAAMNNPEKTEFYNEIKFAPAPAVEAGGKLAGSAWNDYWSIPASFKGDVEAVFQVIMEAADVDNQMKAASLGLVTRTSVIESGVASPAALAAVDTISKGIGPYPKRPTLPLLTAALGNWLPFVGTGEMTPEEALQKAEEEYINGAKAQGYLK